MEEAGVQSLRNYSYYLTRTLYAKTYVYNKTHKIETPPPSRFKFVFTYLILYWTVTKLFEIHVGILIITLYVVVQNLRHNNYNSCSKNGAPIWGFRDNF